MYACTQTYQIVIALSVLQNTDFSSTVFIDINCRRNKYKQITVYVIE